MQGFLNEIIRILTEAQVEFVIVGGISAVLQGAPVVTRDLDICYRRTAENHARLAKALAPLKPRLRALPADVPNVFDARSLDLGSNFTLEVGGESLDLLGEMSALGGFEQIAAQADEMEVSGHRVKVLSLADLIRTKKAANRPKDHAMLPLLEATLRMKEQGNKGDG